MCAPGINGLVVEFNISSKTISTLAITLYILGISIGPMLMSPLSEMYGRLPVYHIANMVFVAFMIGSALSINISQFMVFRFISGCAGGTPMALGGGTVADIFPAENRGLAMALFSLGPLAGPVRYNSPSSAVLQLTFPIRLLVLCLGVLLQPAKAGAGRFGYWQFSAALLEPPPSCSCVKHCPRLFLSEKQHVYDPLLAIQI